MMTRKDFETVAWIVGAARKAVGILPDNQKVLLSFDAIFLPMVLEELKTNNPRFDAVKFCEAAGVNVP
jgi:hypothetical protein